MNRANEVLFEFIKFLYETKPIHPKTWEITCALPWGESGYKQWGLSNVEARCLRSILIQRASTQSDTLFDYNFELKCWHLDLHYYRYAVDAVGWINEHPITQREWDKATNEQRDAARDRKQRQRQAA